MEGFSFRLESSLDPIPDPDFPASEASVVLVFGLREHLEDPALLANLKETFPNAQIAGASTAGEIHDYQFWSESVVGLAIRLEKSTCRMIEKSSQPEDDFAALGNELGRELSADDLRMVLLFAEGLEVDCDLLLRGLNESLADTDPLIFGGLAGDSLNFENTVLLTSAGLKPEGIIAIGFYGEALEIRTAVSEKYSELGPLHEVTKADGNLLIEIDGRRALDVFLEELGPVFRNANEATESLFDFPMVFENAEGGAIFARTPMYVDESAGTLLYAGSLPHDRFRFAKMQGNRDLLEGALEAARKASMQGREELLFMVSCAARRVALGVAVGAELDEVAPVFSPSVPAIGFYAYGEIGRSEGSGKAETLNHSFNLITCREA